jgi:ornithine carbamoyltransferase
MNRSELTGRDYISTADWAVEALGVALDVAAELKGAFEEGEAHRLLPDKTLFMIFLDLSTRTRNAFEAGMTQLGGHAHFIDAATSQIAHGEDPRDMGIILSSYGHGIAIRHDKVPGEGNAYMRSVAAAADAPVINLQCDIDHPTQQLADLMTIEEVFGTRDLSGMKVCVRSLVREADERSPGSGAAAPALRRRCDHCPATRVPAHERGHGTGATVGRGGRWDAC